MRARFAPPNPGDPRDRTAPLLILMAAILYGAVSIRLRERIRRAAPVVTAV
jgi:hypothetical protein